MFYTWRVNPYIIFVKFLEFAELKQIFQKYFLQFLKICLKFHNNVYLKIAWHFY